MLDNVLQNTLYSCLTELRWTLLFNNEMHNVQRAVGELYIMSIELLNSNVQQNDVKQLYCM